MNWGATLLDVNVPDRDGELANVNLSFDSLTPYLNGHPYFGSTVGRFCNRIGNASFNINGQRYEGGEMSAELRNKFRSDSFN